MLKISGQASYLKDSFLKKESLTFISLQRRFQPNLSSEILVIWPRPQIACSTLYILVLPRSDLSKSSVQPSWVGDISEKCEGGKVFRSWTSNCCKITTTRSYSCKFHSRDNDLLYLINLSQISKIHVDFRVICRHHQDNTSSISEESELYGECENRILSSQ